MAGVTNKFLSRFVDRIATCFEEVKSDFKGQESKIILTGNPRGQEVVATPKMDTIRTKFRCCNAADYESFLNCFTSFSWSSVYKITC